MEQLNRLVAAFESIAGSLAVLAGAAASAPAAKAETTTAAAAAADKPKGRGRAATTKPKEPEVTQEQVNDALSALKDFIDEVEGKEAKAGIAAAREVMKKAAGVAKMAEIPEDKYAAVIVAAEQALEAAKEAADEDGDM